MTFRERLMLGCAGLLVAACATVFVRYGAYHHLIRQLSWDNAFTQTLFSDDATLQHYRAPRTIPDDEVPIDWAARYPFPQESLPADVPTQKEDSFLQKLQQKKQVIQQRENQFSDWTNRHFFQQQSFVYAKNVYENSLGWNIALLHDYSSVVQMPDGYLTAFLERRDLSRQADATIKLADFCRAHHVAFLMVLGPGKISRSDPYASVFDFSNENGDAFLSKLRENNIDCLDLRAAIEAEQRPQHSLFFRTDHHWTPAAARWAAKNICEHLNAFYGYTADLSLFDATKFDEKKYSAFYLGSHGIQRTRARSIPDDFSLYHPKFSTSFHLSIPSMDIDRTGDFSIFYDMKKMTPLTAYDTYAYGNRALLQIQNQAKKDGRKLLLIHDSFADVMTPFLALGMEYLQSIDPRYFYGSLQTFIEKERPDTVILFYDIIEFNLDGHHATPRSPFDLR